MIARQNASGRPQRIRVLPRSAGICQRYSARSCICNDRFRDVFASDIGIIHGIHTSRISWHASAACRGLTRLMFASGSQEVACARAICRGCPAISECLAEADALACRGSEDDGIRGGLTATERRARRQSTAA